MDEKTIKTAGKAELRRLCKQHGIKYGSMPNEGMRTMLRATLKPDDHAHVAERFGDTPVFKVINKVTAPSVLDLLKSIPAGDSFSVKEIAKRTGSTEATVRTIIGNCNSAAPSNARFHNMGLRFEVKRGSDFAARKK